MFAPSNDPSGSTPATGIQTILTKPNGYGLPKAISASANPQPLPLSPSMTKEQAVRWLLAFEKQMRSELSSNLLSVAKRDNAEAGNLELYKNPFGLLYAPLMPGISSPTEAEMIEARSSSSKSAATNMKKEQDKHRQKLQKWVIYALLYETHLVEEGLRRGISNQLLASFSEGGSFGDPGQAGISVVFEYVKTIVKQPSRAMGFVQKLAMTYRMDQTIFSWITDCYVLEKEGKKLGIIFEEPSQPAGGQDVEARALSQIYTDSPLVEAIFTESLSPKEEDLVTELKANKPDDVSLVNHLFDQLKPGGARKLTPERQQELRRGGSYETRDKAARQKLLVILKSKDEQQDERQPPRKFPMSAPDPPKPGDEIPAGRVTCDSCGKQHAGVCWFDVRKTNNAGSVHEERRNQVPGADGGERTRGRSRSSSRNRSNSDRGSHEATPSRFQPRPPQEGGSKD